MNKAGALINFYYPRIIEMAELKKKEAKNGDDEDDSKMDKSNNGDMSGRGGPGNGAEYDDGSR